ncbi:MAG: OmpA family protein, partial [Paramuribaculum sp.]|nr:OmpA family protein [Paramuribaculum sp.]
MNKFKSLILAGAVLVSSFAASAQTIERRLIEPEKTVFAPHWFMQAQGGGAFTVGEASFGDLISPAAALNIGYRFSPVFSLRAGASGWRAKGAAHYNSANHLYKFDYVQANVDAMLSLTNLFCGWNPTRTLDFYAFVGVGANDRFHNDEALAIAKQGYPFSYLWDGHKWAFAGRGGLGVNIRLSDIVALNVEANANGLTDHFNSKHGKDSNIDWQFNGLIGLTIKFGKGYKTIPAVYEEIIIEPEPEP